MQRSLHYLWIERTSHASTTPVKNVSVDHSCFDAQVTLRIDNDVLEWFKSQGRGYQTQINQLLRAYMEAHQ